MAKPPARSIYGQAFKNFLNSFKYLLPQHNKEQLIGNDYFGNKYYEIAADPSSGRRRPSRWFEPPEKENFEQEMPAEWEAWLRGRRKEPPKDEEVMKNLAIMQMKKKNALELDAKYANAEGKDMVIKAESKGAGSFPEYNEYELNPGNPRKKN